MELELRQEIRCGQVSMLELQCLNAEEIALIVGNNSPFKGQCPRRNQIGSYLQNVNDELVRRDINMPELGAKYLIAASFYNFVRRVVSLEVCDKTEASFRFIVGKFPYLIKNPFDLYINNNLQSRGSKYLPREHPSESLIVIDDGALDEGTFRNEINQLSETDKFKSKLEQSLRTIVLQNLKPYNPKGHFEFVAFYNICFPLFGVQRKNQEYERISLELAERYGCFVMKIPRNLKEALEESSL